MNYIVKEMDNSAEMRPVQPEKKYELLSTETVKDVNNKDVTIPKSLGWFSVTSLELEKTRLTEMIAEIDAKLSAISAQATNV